MSAPDTGCDRQLRCPTRGLRHKTGKFFSVGGAVRHLGDDLVVTVEYDRISGRFDALHRFKQQIARDSAYNVFRPGPAVCAVAVPTVDELTGGVVAEDDDLFPRTYDLDARVWI